tara:strand:- start:35 stop:625 length:591 start_codon:yes stop_codon:yes gene_type:complete
MISIELVTTKEQKQEVKHIIETYHSYVASAASVGRRIDWLIYDTQEGSLPECIGMIGLGSSVYPPPKDLLRKVGLSKDEYRLVFNNFANNWRFCLKKKVPNAGTQILKLVRNSCQRVWKEKYGDDLHHLLTFVAGGNTGAVYKADNWEVIGETAGLPAHKSSSMKWDNSEKLKEKFVKPTGENKKIILYKKLKPAL